MTTNDNVIEYKLKNYMRDGENIHIFKMCSRKNNKRHTHDCIELCIFSKVTVLNG